MVRTVLGLALALTSMLVGCGEDDPVLFADIQFHTQCQRQSGCSNYRSHDVNNLDDEGGFALSCNAETNSMAQRVVEFGATSPDGWKIEVSSLVLPLMEEVPISPIGMARIQVTEDDYVYVGQASANPPSAMLPCRLFEIMVSQTPDGPELTGKFICADITARQDAQIKRDVTAPSATITSMPPACDLQMPPCTVTASAPAYFRILNCPGL